MNPLSPLSVFMLFGRIAWRRMLNRSASMKLPSLKKKTPGSDDAVPRGATLHRAERKSLMRRMLGMWLPLCSLLGVALLSLNTMFVILDSQLLEESRTAAVLRLSPADYANLQEAAATADGTERDSAVDQVLSNACSSPASWLTDARKQLARTRFDEQGLQAFEPRPDDARWGGTLACLSPDGRCAALRAVGVYLLVVNLAILCTAFGLIGRHLSRGDSALAWLWQFPLSRRVLFSAKVVEYAVDTPAVMVTWLFYASILWLSGASFAAGLGIGLLLGASATLITAAVRLAAEVFLTQRLGRRMRGSIVAVVSAAGSGALLVAMIGSNSQMVIETFNRATAALPAWICWNPFTAGIGTDAMVAAGNGSPWWLAAPATAVLVSLLAILLAAHLTRQGLASGHDSARVDQRPALRTSSPPASLGALAWKELLQLRRQPELASQILATPLMIVGLLFVGGYQKIIDLATNGGTSISVAILVSVSYMLMVAAAQMIGSELKMLWLLQSQPRPLADVVRLKARVWAVIAMGLSVPFIGLAIVALPSAAPAILVRLPFLFAAMWWLPELIFGLTALSATVTGDQAVRFRRGAMWLPALIVSNAALAIYSQNGWQQVSVLAVLAILNAAVRERQIVELSWLSEPVETPPKKYYAMHGLLAVVGFQTLLGGLNAALLQVPGLSLTAVTTVAYCLSAVTVCAILGSWLRRNRLSVLPSGPRGPIVRPVFLGLAASCAAGLVVTLGLCWLQYECNVPAFARHDTARYAAYDKWCHLFLLVVAAPIFEEWVFRGLLYQTLRRTWGIAASVAVTAVLFATLHPLAGSVALLTLGAATALTAEKTGRLWPSIAIHAGYNLMVWSLCWV